MTQVGQGQTEGDGFGLPLLVGVAAVVVVGLEWLRRSRAARVIVPSAADIHVPVPPMR
ncbi:hypothetical protein [Sphingomonas montana]|uniref:hypothetical protein n=1 Tax=Sphingomonas montana TaxID=1843236 RepID=UPI0013ED74C8|nr:hypothetical protein [Sphingomonas montana]